MRIIKKRITFRDLDESVVIGQTQKGDIIVNGGIFVETAFDGTTPVIDVGFVKDNAGGTADPDALASAVGVNVVGAQAATVNGTTTNKACTVPDQVVAKLTVASGTPSEGSAIIWFGIINENPNN